MKHASKNWRQVRRVTLERAQRNIVHPLLSVQTAFLVAISIYFGGLLRFSIFYTGSSEFFLFDVFQAVTLVAASIAIMLLLGPVVILGVLSRRFERLLGEQ